MRDAISNIMYCMHKALTQLCSHLKETVLDASNFPTFQNFTLYNHQIHLHWQNMHNLPCFTYNKLPTTEVENVKKMPFQTNSMSPAEWQRIRFLIVIASTPSAQVRTNIKTNTKNFHSNGNISKLKLMGVPANFTSNLISIAFSSAICTGILHKAKQWHTIT